MFEEILNAFAGQADGIDHPALKLGHARWRVADAVFARDGFGNERAEPVDVHHLRELGRERPGRGHDWILQRNAADLDRHVYHPTASCRSNTGPSIQTRRSSFL